MISVIIPYHNRFEKLQRCLHSVLNQSFSNFEVLIVDDASENPLLLDDHPKVRIFRNTENRGPGFSRNVGLSHAQGNFIAFLDSDDYWHPDFLKISYKTFLEHPKVAMVYANGMEVDSDQHVIGFRRNKIKKPTSILPEIISVNRHWGTGGCVWRKNVIQNIRWSNLFTWEDYVFDVEAALQNNAIVGIEDALVYYDISGNDKLSARNPTLVLQDKIQGILTISKLLFHSSYKKDSKIKYSTNYLLLMSLLEMNELAINDLNLKKTLEHEFRHWNSFFINYFLRILLKFPDKQEKRGLEYLTRFYRKLRN